MLVLFHGDDNYSSYIASKKKLAEDSALSEKQPLVIDAKGLTISDLKQYVSNIGLFDKGNVILLKRITDNPSLITEIVENLEEWLQTDIILWEDKSIKSPLVNELSKAKRVYEFTLPKYQELEKWVITRANEIGANLKPIHAQLLIQICNQDMLRIINELQKLHLYSQAKQEPITEDMIMKTCADTSSGNIWKFLDDLSNGSLSGAMQEYGKLTSISDNTQYLISMLARELRLLAEVKFAQESGDTSNVKLAPFVLKKTKEKVKRFSSDRIKKLGQALLRLDIAIKSGEIDPTIGLFIYITAWK